MCPLDSTVNGRSIMGQLGRPSTVEMARFQEPHGGETRTVGKLRLRRIRWHYYLAFDLQNNLVHLESATLISHMHILVPYFSLSIDFHKHFFLDSYFIHLNEEE